jgi:hypothetical protein
MYLTPLFLCSSAALLSFAGRCKQDVKGGYTEKASEQKRHKPGTGIVEPSEA